jgi:hypothetical protein
MEHSNVKRLLLSFFVSTAIAIAVAELGAFAYVTANDGFGRGDLLPFLIWLIPFGLLVATAVGVGQNWLHNAGAAGRACYGAVAGAIVGVAWTFALAGIMGPWFGTFSFPVLRVLGGSGALSGTFASALWRRRA